MQEYEYMCYAQNASISQAYRSTRRLCNRFSFCYACLDYQRQEMSQSTSRKEYFNSLRGSYCKRLSTALVCCVLPPPSFPSPSILALSFPPSSLPPSVPPHLLQLLPLPLVFLLRRCHRIFLFFCVLAIPSPSLPFLYPSSPHLIVCQFEVLL